MSLTRYLKHVIEFSGPISVAQYMKISLTHPKLGYYARDVFGKKGDYVTAPEISHLMGELCGLWCAASLKTKTPIQLVELGPGRGTMLLDVLQSLSCFDARIYRVVLVESSPYLREMQLKNLTTLLGKATVKRSKSFVQSAKFDQLEVVWEDTIDMVEQVPSFIYAHEFFDAMPVYKFKKTSEGWREILVDYDSKFQYTLSKLETPNLGYLNLINVGEKTVVEVSPDALLVAQKIGKILKNGGCGLIIDYGHDYPSEASLRAIKNHQFVDIFEEPGSCDLSVDVDFSALKKQIPLSYGPIPQSVFLSKMGIKERVQILVKKYNTEIIKDYERLMSMSSYKVLGLSSQFGFN